MDTRPLPSFSIVLETDNLAIMPADLLASSLASIAAQSHRAKAEGIYLVDGGQSPIAVLDRVQQTHPWLEVVRAGPQTLYIALKERGAGLSRSEVLVFCDSDVQYEPGWLEALLSTFRDPAVQIVAGETTTPISGAYSLAFALTFHFPRLSGETALARSPIYWANNFAARRELLARMPLPDPAELYRGQNLIHSLALERDGQTIWRQPLARGWHAVPPVGKVLRRYVTLGRDSVHVARLARHGDGPPFLEVMAPDRGSGRRISRILGRIRQLATREPMPLLLLPLALPIVAVFGLCYFAGRRSALREVAATPRQGMGEA